jgi:7-cyano-7-deazaguanine synthase
MIVLLSGGLDSTVLAGQMLTEGHPVEAVSVDYGQRHGARELVAAAQVAVAYGIRHDVIGLAALADHLGGSALTGDRPVPEGHYSAPSMAATVVPNRNMIMLAIAAGIAAARGHDTVATAVHSGDHPIYPDCRPEFIMAVSRAAELGTAGHGDVVIRAPFARIDKARIVHLGDVMGAPMGLSWSCYLGGEVHCGRCGTCVERAEAFKLAGVTDPTTYADAEFAARVT